MRTDESTRPTDAQGRPLGRVLKLALAIAALGGLAVLSDLNYLVFHSLVELFGVAVALAVCMIAWNVRRRLSNDFLLFVAIAFAAVSLLDLVHTLAYRGMGAISGLTADEPTQLWIAARYLQALCLLLAPVWLTRRLRCLPTLVALGAIDALVLLSVFARWPWLPRFPACHLGAAGLTPFKIVSEYVICGILLAALGWLWLRRRRLDREVFAYVAAALVVTVASELAFTNYVSVNARANMVGHLLKVVAVYLTYRALIAAGLQRPFDVLFGDLADSERRFRMLTAATFEGIAISEQGRLVDCNDQLARMLGCPREELVGLDIASVIHPDDRSRVLDAIARDVESHVEHRMRSKDGRWLVVEAHGQAVTDRERKIRLTAIRDVTQRRQDEEALRRTAAELARSNHELEQFGFLVSHDLQEPLRAVTGFLSLLSARSGADLDPKAREFVALATDGAQRMSHLIHALLDYARINEGAREPAPVDMTAVCGQARANCAASIRETRATVTCERLPTVMGDATQLTQLLQNLIGNAVKFRRPDVPPQVQVSARRDGGQWVFEVRDNGLGVPADQTDGIFQLFQRLHTREEFAGSGVGLPICRKIVERHGGRIWVESAIGAGSTFLFTLPAAGS